MVRMKMCDAREEEAAVKMFVFRRVRVYIKDGVSLWSRMAMIATGTSAIMLSDYKKIGEKVKQPEHGCESLFLKCIQILKRFFTDFCLNCEENFRKLQQSD